ncbi:polysaccharide pyruvyl transferase family protein [Cyclobacterium plantarum]|uniref:Polysaccharide pyruvyl transferase family protein n=1 Tax=Cyclobacterium plantarum TaxID=2716263 RepID=A0ABX0HBR4_9BACT|nr:polysaccharide pyruvyl transferase family protein [Cyclobacterium plantarum]NHE59339.1 polysaccharide pyruvyl transferase family protein [Cyclobacterium plantarum]
MKIKILTFHSELNYGANLQAYALKAFLSSQGNDVSFINYKRKKKYSKLLLFIINVLGKSPGSTYSKFKRNLVELKFDFLKAKVFKKFQDENLLRTSATYRSLKQLQETPPDADMYIVGSDQIWSPKIVLAHDMPVYFLNFGHETIKRISYAASSGGEVFSNDMQAVALDSLSKFDQLGAREDSLVFYLTRIGLAKAEWTPDPTFLINWKEHLNLNAENKRKKVSKFILAKGNQERGVILESLACSLDSFSDLEKLDMKGINFSPFDWIRAISKSKLLITDSYHAVLFALFTHTPFLFLKWGKGFNRDERILSLLKRLELNQLAVDGTTIASTTEASLMTIDWSFVDERIISMGDVGKTFLSRALK